jgi:replicative DNA helicase
MNDNDRTPPHDAGAELAVIGCALLEPRSMVEIGDLGENDFFSPECCEAWRAIRMLSEAGKPVDILTVGEELRSSGMDHRFDGGWSTWAVATSAQTPTIENVAYYARIIRSKATLRRTIALCFETMNRCFSGATADEVVASARDGIAELESMCVEDAGPMSIAKILPGAIDAIAKRCDPSSKPMLIPTGIASYDARLGGFGEEEMIIIAGRPGKGKTSYGNGVARSSVRAAFPTLVFSLEMSTQLEAERFLSIETGIPATHLRSGRDDSGKPLGLKEYQAIVAAAGRLESQELYIDSRPLTLGQIISAARKWNAKYARGKGVMGFVVIDYIQLISLETKGRESSREQQVARISKSLKWLAKDLHCPVAVLCQLNREIEKRGGKPQLSDLRESGSIEQDADIVIFPWQLRGEEDLDPNGDCEAEIIVGKNRTGPVGAYPAMWRAKTMQYVSKETHQQDDGRGAGHGNWQDGRE